MLFRHTARRQCLIRREAILRILITGVAGFIGNAAVLKFFETPGTEILGIDDLNPYYDVRLKEARLGRLTKKTSFFFHRFNLIDKERLDSIFSEFKPDKVVHLAAQAGVRYSLENPFAYVDSNLVAFVNVLECCRHYGVKHLVFASSSSVYGGNRKMPFSEADSTDHPVSLYGATKKANEVMAHSYSHLFNLPATGLRFFTVYGPWGRPDMSLFKFADRMTSGQEIEVYNQGNHLRDFTFVDDIIEGVARVTFSEPPTKGSGLAPFQIYNIGNGKPVELLKVIQILERALGLTAKKKLVSMQAGDVESTWADVSALERDFDFRPKTSIEEGVSHFVDWYRGWRS